MNYCIFPGDGQPQTSAAGMAFAGGVGTPEAIKHQVFLPRLQPHAVVDDGDGHGVVSSSKGHFHRVAFAVVDGVGDEVAHDAFDAAGVHHHRHGLVRFVEGYLHVEFFGEVLHLAPCGVDAGPDVDAVFREVGHAGVVAGDFQQFRQK